MHNDEVTSLPIIGWREWVKLPDLGAKRIKAKVDTGARSSSLHAFDIEEFERDNEAWVRFQIHPRQRRDDLVIEATAKIHDRRSVRSSSGKASVRYVILTTVVLYDQPIEIDLTLANRDKMGFRMLLGREAFRRRFLVDAGGSYYGWKPKRKRKAPTKADINVKDSTSE